MTKQKLLQNIADIDGALESSYTDESFKPDLLALKAKFQAELNSMASEPEPKEKVSAAKKIAASVIKKPKAEKVKKVPAAKKGESKEGILQKISDIDGALESSYTDDEFKPDLLALKSELEAKLKDFDNAPAVKEKVSAAKKIAASVVKKAKVAPVKKERVAKVKKEKVVKAVVAKKAAKEPVKKKNILEDCKEILKTYRKKKQHDKERAEGRAKKGKPAKLTPSETIAKSAAAVKTKVIDIKEAKKGISQSEISKITNSIVSTVSSTLSGIIEVANKHKFVKGLVSELRSLEDSIAKNKKVSGSKYEEGGETEGVGVDLFEDYENIPADVQEVLDRHQDDFMDGSYDGLGQALDELEPLGYTFDFGLDVGAYDLRKFGQRGKSEDMEYAVGGRTSRGISRDRMFISHQEHEKKYKRKTAGKSYESGGELENENAEALLSKVHELNHHLEEIEEIVGENTEVEPWVLNRAQRAATDLSDITHYLENESKKHEGSMEQGGFFAEGGQVDFAQLSNIHSNIMGTISFDLKIKGMRKPQDFIVYPIAAGESNKSIKIQSDTRIGKIDLIGGVGVMSQSHAGGAYGVHLAMDKKTVFKLSDADLGTLKARISGTAGDRVGSMGISSDNSGASMMADGGHMAKGGKTIIVGNIEFLDGSALVHSVDNTYKADNKAEQEKIEDMLDGQGVDWLVIEDFKGNIKYADGHVMAKGGEINYDSYSNRSKEYIQGEIAHTERSQREFDRMGDMESAQDRKEHAQKLREIYHSKKDGMADGGQAGQQELFLEQGGDCYGCGGEMDKYPKRLIYNTQDKIKAKEYIKNKEYEKTYGDDFKVELEEAPYDNFTDYRIYATYKGENKMAKGGKVNKKYNYFAVDKNTNKIVTGFETKDVESLKAYYAKQDLMDMDLNPSDYKILSAKYLLAKGIDPFTFDNWRKMESMAKGGATFSDKVESISERLEGSKVPLRLKKDYGAKYDKKESVSAAKRIAGSILAKSKRK